MLLLDPTVGCHLWTIHPFVHQTREIVIHDISKVLRHRRGTGASEPPCCCCPSPNFLPFSNNHSLHDRSRASHWQHHVLPHATILANLMRIHETVRKFTQPRHRTYQILSARNPYRNPGDYALAISPTCLPTSLKVRTPVLLRPTQDMDWQNFWLLLVSLLP